MWLQLLFLVIGLVAGAAVYWLVSWMKSKDKALTWYEWVIGIVGLVLLFLAIQNYIGYQAELEPGPASMTLLVIGLPAVILLAVTGVLVSRRLRA